MMSEFKKVWLLNKSMSFKGMHENSCVIAVFDDRETAHAKAEAMNDCPANREDGVAVKYSLSEAMFFSKRGSPD